MDKSGYTVVIPEHIKKKIEEAPPEVQEEIEKLVKKFVTGDLDPTKVGKEVHFKELIEKLRCGECGSKDIDWNLEEDDEEVYYRCHACCESAWMTKAEYEVAKKRHPDLVFKSES